MESPSRAAIDEDIELRLAEEVDEARGDDATVDVDAPPRRSLGEVADGDDLLSPDTDVGVHAWRPGPVDDVAVLEDEVERLRRSAARRTGDDKKDDGEDRSPHVADSFMRLADVHREHGAARPASLEILRAFLATRTTADRCLVLSRLELPQDLVRPGRISSVDPDLDRRCLHRREMPATDLSAQPGLAEGGEEELRVPDARATREEHPLRPGTTHDVALPGGWLRSRA